MMTVTFRRTLLVFAALTFLAGCSGLDWGGDNDAPLEGERISILQLEKAIVPDNGALAAQGFAAPSPWRNDFWPQAGGYPNHSMQHLELNTGELKRAWSVSIGRGSSPGLPLTAQPVIADGRVFTLDTGSILSAFAVQDGKKIWTLDVRDVKEDDPVIGGGLAYSQGRLYVTNGYDEVLAVSPQEGKIVWRADIPTPARAAPAILDERVFVSTLDNRLLALSAADGQLLWEYSGIAENTGLVGAAAPAVSREVVIPAFSSGELYALRIENGAPAWTENLSAFRRTVGLEGIADIRGLPVIDKGLVIAISFGGKIVAIDERTGERVWQREIGGSETPWVAGNHVFVLSSDNELVALGRDNGLISWVTSLPRYENPDSRKGPIFWTGPVLAGGRLIMAGSGGRVAEFAAEDGKPLRQWDMGDTVRIPMAVAGGTLYMLAENGTLSAYR